MEASSWHFLMTFVPVPPALIMLTRDLDETDWMPLDAYKRLGKEEVAAPAAS